MGANAPMRLPEWVVTAPDLHTFKKGVAHAIPNKFDEYVKKCHATNA